MKKIIIIETSDVGAAHTAEASKKLGYEPVFIFTPSNYQADTYNQLIKYPHYECSDTTQLEPLIKTIDANNIQNIAAVITMLDSRLNISYQLADFLKVSGIDKAIITLSDKAKVAELISEYSPLTVIFNKHDIPYRCLEKLFSKNEKLIIKPTQGAGALGMFMLNSIEELKQLSNLIEKTNLQTLIHGHWIAQPLLPGRLISLEGYAIGGKANFIGFTARQKVGNTESINHFPANNFLTDKAIKTAYAAINTLVQRSAYKNGYFHAEFIVNQDDCHLIDANFGRVGGGGIAQQLAMSYQKNPTDLFCHLINTSIFGEIHNHSDLYAIEPIKTLSINYGLQETSVLTNLILPNHFHGLHTQILNNGAIVPKMGINNWSWLSIAVGYPRELLNSLNEIQIVTDRGNFKPFYLEGGMAHIERIDEYLPQL
ncbi:MAG TPA: ATP-grasp domain-containing protein [Patescibacteria group bacterium]|nr:ATP-grasp domain-containing protein [Gammaproteobacteria bacterium]HWA52519.1 ATP-grasp domain-containing protein [Patescibacteria group bacterium]